MQRERSKRPMAVIFSLNFNVHIQYLSVVCEDCRELINTPWVCLCCLTSGVDIAVCMVWLVGLMWIGGFYKSLG